MRTNAALFMKTNAAGIARAALVAASLFLMSACTIAPRSAETESPANQVSANEYANRCSEQTSLLKHELALCRSVPLVRVPLQ
jgi:hypothetical protein